MLSLGETHLPNFPIPDNLTSGDYLSQQAQAGLERYLKKKMKTVSANALAALRERYQQRLQVELDVINSMGYPGYFLIVADFIAWAKEQDIPVGPGRGSGAGSLVAYVLRITDIDPKFWWRYHAI